MNAKRLTTGSVAVLLVSLALGAWAQCDKSIPVQNAAAGVQQDIGGDLDDGTGKGNVVTSFWLLGSGVQNQSGAMPSTAMVTPLTTFAYSYLQHYMVNADWSHPDVLGGCPTTKDRTVFLYSIENGGKGQFLVMTAGYDSQTLSFNFDNLSNGNGTMGPASLTPVFIPPVALEDEVSSEAGWMTYDVSWKPMDLKGFFDAPPGRNLVTGVMVYFLQCTGFPEDTRVSAWRPAPGGALTFGTAGLDPGSARVSFPATPGLKTYLALAPVFDDLKTAAFVGQPTLAYEALYPRPRPRPLQWQGGTVTVVGSGSGGTQVSPHTVTAAPFVEPREWSGENDPSASSATSGSGSSQVTPLAPRR